jgi:hypothetical protein
VLARSPEGGLAAIRTPAPGELYRYHLDRLTWMDELVAGHGVRRALNTADLEAAHRSGEPAVIADVEGLDFLEGKLERLEEAHRRASAMCSSCITRRTRSAISRPGQSPIKALEDSAPKDPCL